MNDGLFEPFQPLAHSTSVVMRHRGGRAHLERPAIMDESLLELARTGAHVGEVDVGGGALAKLRRRLFSWRALRDLARRIGPGGRQR